MLFTHYALVILLLMNSPVIAQIAFVQKSTIANIASKRSIARMNALLVYLNTV